MRVSSGGWLALLVMAAAPAHADLDVPRAAPAEVARTCSVDADGRLIFIAGGRVEAELLPPMSRTEMRAGVADELRRAGVAIVDGVDAPAIVGVMREWVIRRYYSREMREAHNLPLHDTQHRVEPVTLDAVDARRKVGVLLLLGRDRLDLRFPLPTADHPPSTEAPKSLADAVARMARLDLGARSVFIAVEPGLDDAGATEAALRADTRAFVACLRRHRRL